MSFLSYFKPAVQNLLAPGTSFVENNVSMDRVELGDVLQMIQVHLLLCSPVPNRPGQVAVHSPGG